MYEPGTSFNYGLSTDLVGCILERVTKKSLREVLRDELLQPLGMVDADFYVPADKVDRVGPFGSHLGGVLHKRPPTEVKTLKRGLGEKPKLESGGGGLFSTAQDYIKFMKLLINGGLVGGKRLLQQSTVNQLTRVNQLREMWTRRSSSRAWQNSAVSAGPPWYYPHRPRACARRTLSGTGEYGWEDTQALTFRLTPSATLPTSFSPSSCRRSLPIRQQVKFMVHKCATASQASSETDKAKGLPIMLV